jgi:hypothetical protein
MSKLGELKQTRNIYLFCTAAFFAAMPTKAFLAISSDIIQVAAILLPFTIAFMIVIATGDVGAGLPRNEVISQRLGNRRNSMRVQLIEIISSNLQLIAATIGAKALCV